MCEPMNTLDSRVFNACVFCGPAQAGKTEGLLLGWLSFSVSVSPMDMIFFTPSNAAARDFGVRRVDRLHRNSPAIGRLLSPRRDENNRMDKMYKSGVLLTLSWPSVTEFAGRPVGRVALTDFDRMDDDIDGDGNPFDLASKRTTTFGSYAMTLAESSPSRPILDPNWLAKSAHEAPPTTGILALYNRGDRRRWVWPCPSCSEYFEGNFRLLAWDTTLKNRVEASETVKMVCPHCAYGIAPNQREEMQARGVWIADGQRVDKTGQISGKAARSNIASFWLNGCAAAFVSWPQLVMMYLAAQEEHERTGTEDALRKFYNNDLAEPYVEKAQETKRLPEVLKSRARQQPEREVPQEVRCLIACVDVQTNMFVVQVHGIAPGVPFDTHIIDRFDIRKSRRTDEDDDAIWVKPGSYLEDWDLLIEQVIEREYPLADQSGRRMQVKLTLCDSGGREGVTTNAYAFFRKLRKEGKHHRFHLVKGEHAPSAPRTQIRFPDSSTRSTGTKAGARGDIPVLFLNSNSMKDALANRLEVAEEGKGMFHYPDWLPDWFYRELCSENRTPKGWEIVRGGRQRNEAWDLAYYYLGACFHPSLLDMERVNWERPPAWLMPPKDNPLVVGGNDENVAASKKARYSFADFGKALG